MHLLTRCRASSLPLCASSRLLHPPRARPATAVQAFVSAQFLTDYCADVLPSRFAPADYSVLLRTFLERLTSHSYSALVTTAIIRSLIVPTLTALADRGELEVALPQELLDSLLACIGDLQAPQRLQCLLTNVRRCLPRVASLPLGALGSVEGCTFGGSARLVASAWQRSAGGVCGLQINFVS